MIKNNNKKRAQNTIVFGIEKHRTLIFSSLAMIRITALARAEIEDILDKHGMQLLALAHAYQIGWLKKKCEITVATELTPDRVIDMLKVAKLCDAPRLYQQCMKLIAKEFAEVQRSDGWQFLRRYDPALELEILQTIEDTNQVCCQLISSNDVL